MNSDKRIDNYMQLYLYIKPISKSNLKYKIKSIIPEFKYYFSTIII